MIEDNKRSYGEIWKNRLRKLSKACRWLAILAVAVVVVYLVLDQIMCRRVVAQREVFLEKFGGVDFEDFRPERPPPHEDAGRVYSYAIALVAKATALYDYQDAHTLLVEPKYAAETFHLDNPPTLDETVPFVREQLAAMQEGLDLVREATSLNQGSIIADYNPEHVLPALAQARVLARNIAAKAQVTAIDGNSEEALEWVAAGLHFANSFRNEPQLISQLVRVALTGLAVSAAQEILNVSEDSPPISESLRRELDIARRQQDFIRTLAGEAAWSWKLSSTSGFPRLLTSAQQFHYNRFLFDLVDTMQDSAPLERQQALAEVEERAKSSPLPLSFSMVPLLGPAVVRSVQAYDRNVAQCDLLELALALRAYKKQHGTYPDRLSLLTPTYMDVLPIDPFSGEDYLYKLEEEGFLLYSVGTDLEDDGGIKPKGRTRGDIVWKMLK